MKFKNAKGVDISKGVIQTLQGKVPDFEDVEAELKRLGLGEDQVKLLKVRYESESQTAKSP